MYSSVVAALKGKFRIVLIDGPGHGASGPGPERGFTMRECAQAMKAVLDELGIARASVGGTSWGGLVGGEFALLYPERTHSLALINTPVFANPSMSDRMIVVGTRLIGNTRFFAEQVAKGFFAETTRSTNPPELRSFYSHLSSQPKASLAHSIEQVLVKREALAPRLGGINAPTLVVLGKQDDMYPAAELAAAVSKIPRHELVLLDTKHISPVDSPVEVAALLEKLLTATP